jgi:hypothetical protein
MSGKIIAFCVKHPNQAHYFVRMDYIYDKSFLARFRTVDSRIYFKMTRISLNA